MPRSAPGGGINAGTCVGEWYGYRNCGSILGLVAALGLVAVLGTCLTAQADALPAGAAAASNPPETLSEVTIVGTAPLPGSGIDINKVPSNVQTMSAADLNRDDSSDSLPQAAARHMSSVTLNDEQGSPFQPDFVYRGFEASPISGIAEGLAVYQNGTRINEAYGDTVNWDLMPSYAVNRLTVQGDNPVFGLNALGGAVTIEMKNGFNYQDSEAQLSAGSYGNLTGHGEYGARFGDFGLYLAAGGLEDGGFRYQSPTALRQAYADAGYEHGQTTLHLSLTAADDNIGAVGPTPVQMLAQNPRSVFTYPQSMHNEMQMLQLAGSQQAGDWLQLSGNAYWRRFTQYLVDGNTTAAQACNNNAGFFCLGGTNSYPVDTLYSAQGTPVPTSVLPAGATPGELDTTDNHTHSVGAALQTTLTAPIGSHGNHLVAGVSVDRSLTDFGARGELGTLGPTLAATGAGVIIDQATSSTAQPPIEGPVSLRATAAYYGAYLSEAFDLTPKLTWTVSGRLNTAQLNLHDQLGTSLDGDHFFSRFDPGTGITYKHSDALTAYAGYSEANRAPTAGELGCSNPSSPCLLDAFLQSDPPLKQVVARTFESGLRGEFAAHDGPGTWRWNLALFHTDSSNDILLVATPVNGFGYYSNVGTTRRQGVESGIAYHDQQWDVSLNYSLVDATFRESVLLSSNSPAAAADGTIAVHPGDHLPVSPLNRVALQAEYSLSPRWKIGSDVRYVGNEYLVGDESNQEPQLPGYVVAGLHSSLQVNKSVRVFASIDNLFNQTYYTYGAFTQLGQLPPNFNLTDPRTYSPSPGRTCYVGVHVAL